MSTVKHILVCPLNWGLGHAVRCLPIIQTLLNQGQKVSIASDGAALELLKGEFPKLSFFDLPPYNIHYKTSNMFVNIAPQVPKLLQAIRLEKKILHQLIQQNQFDAIISDNRYGIYTTALPSVFVTHQLNIAVPNRWVAAWVRRRNRAYISRYDECWVPDFANEPSLAGALSHSPVFDNVHYIGPLSTMQYNNTEKQYDIIAVLSGLEPQRSYFEKMLLAQAQKMPDIKMLLVAGQTGEMQKRQIGKNIDWQSYMNRKELNQAILASKVYVGRSGYSSLMDIVQLKHRKVILVPTPGQTEQEYLADRFAALQGFVVQQQKDFNLKNALEALQNRTPGWYTDATHDTDLTEFIEQFLNRMTP